MVQKNGRSLAGHSFLKEAGLTRKAGPMRWTKTIPMAMTILFGVGLIAALSKTHSGVTQIPQTISRTPEQQLTLERAVSTQRKFNRYFQKDVSPKLKDCWSRIKGQGSVEIKYTYRKDASGKWIADHLTVAGSTLPRGQELVALQCMEGSVRSTNLPTESSESTYTLYWNWPVPMPANLPQTATQVSAGGLGASGCDGQGAPPHCWMCAPGGCRPSCFGGDACRITGRPFRCLLAGDCGTGGVSGVMGQAMIQ